MSHGELAVQSALRQQPGVAAVGGARREAALGLAAQAVLAHQPGHALAAARTDLRRRKRHRRNQKGSLAAAFLVQLVPETGVEPATYALRMRRSTD